MSYEPGRPECPVCGAAVIDRSSHQSWHVWLWSVVDSRLARYDRVALDAWMREGTEDDVWYTGLDLLMDEDGNLRHRHPGL